MGVNFQGHFQVKTRMKHRVPLAKMVTFIALLGSYTLSDTVASAAPPERMIGVTTYLRDGPGVRYRAVDEAEMGTMVSVLGCADEWCNVLDGGVGGYVAQSTLALPGEAVPLKKPACIVGAEASYHGSRDVLYCRADARSNERPAATTP
jgi:hypothetical protein